LNYNQRGKKGTIAFFVLLQQKETKEGNSSKTFFSLL
jgi:hypothetical protein